MVWCRWSSVRPRDYRGVCTTCARVVVSFGAKRPPPTPDIEAAAHAVVNTRMRPVVGRWDVRQVLAGAGRRGDGLRSRRAAARARIAQHTVARAARLLDDRSAVPDVLAAERAQGLGNGCAAAAARVDVPAKVRARQRDVLRDPVIMRVVRAATRRTAGRGLHSPGCRGMRPLLLFCHVL